MHRTLKLCPNRLLKPVHHLLKTTRNLSLQAMGSVLGRIAEETPKYEVIVTKPNYEIRKYNPVLVAETEYEASQNVGFQRIAGYIFGNNLSPNQPTSDTIAMTAPVVTSSSESSKIAMTAPVVTSPTSSKIAMTAPVASEPANENGKMKMAFVMPSQYTMENIPKPKDPRVVLREVPAETMACVTFSGRVSSTHPYVKELEAQLRQQLESDRYQVTGPARLNQFNPPWTIGPLRTNELCLPVSLVSSL
eukprot:NODE_1615_length_793_cov_16.516517_g1566_i0.p1 GENE.NODE_1615_length_793_cov_16.516517_g1566_i0~~NODE_1615_length_793_cov_16.516517_g1566_i0.p1  ORF type:complete len:248 (+),score=32.21 NODE_1615_length_793_cov_16.516517_g1566_i0:20-763(+)